MLRGSTKLETSQPARGEMGEKWPQSSQTTERGIRNGKLGGCIKAKDHEEIIQSGIALNCLAVPVCGEIDGYVAARSLAIFGIVGFLSLVDVALLVSHRGHHADETKSFGK
jgi:hypothetical protein